MKRKNILTLILAGFFLIIVVLVIVLKDNNPLPEYNDEVTDSVAVVPPPKAPLYGLEIDTLIVFNGEVKSGDSFGKLAGEAGLPTSAIYNIAAKIEAVFDVRKIKAGNRFTLLKGENSQTPSFFVYEESLLEYYVVSLKDSVYALKGERLKTIKEKHVYGVISSSLSQTLNNHTLTNKLSGIYAWTIDFFRIQKGDSIAVIYDEIFIDDSIYAGVGEIKAVRFKHYGNDYYAFNYTDPSGESEFYDETGKSLRKAFLKAPLEYSRISSRFTMRRFHPVQKRWKAHLGTDYAAPRGTPILSTADGVIEKAGYTSGNGNYVKVRHNSVYSTQYLHMSRIASVSKKGNRVRQGDVIGYVGSTGLATGPHVCYRFWKNGKQIDPFGEKLPDANPIKEEYKEAFMAYIKDPMARLNDE